MGSSEHESKQIKNQNNGVEVESGMKKKRGIDKEL